MTLRQRLLTGLRWVIGIFLGLQLAAIATLIGVDSFRKRGRQFIPFPTTRKDPIPVGENAITIYTYGEDVFTDMLAAINSASDHVYFETFIWKGDAVGLQFKRALLRAARRGVKVYVVYDTFANLVVKPTFLRQPATINVRRHPLFASAAFWRLRNTGRDHRKILVVDGKTAFLGGYNIGSLYATGWRDTHARFEGPVVQDIESSFVDYWNSRPLPLIRHARPGMQIKSPSRSHWDSPIRIYRNSPRLIAYPIRNMYLEAIDRAQHNIYLTQAYFIPDEDLRAALINAVTRGVEVKIIIPAESNHVVADWLSRGFYSELLNAGVRLFLYEDAMVHAKTATIDGQWSTIGTANLDRISMAGNYEINAEIISHEVAKAMEEIFAADLTNCLELNKTKWESRSVIAKFTERLIGTWRPFA